MDVQLQVGAADRYSSLRNEDENGLWDSVEAITLREDNQTIVLKIERVEPPPDLLPEPADFTPHEFAHILRVWIVTPLGAAILLKVIDKLLEVFVHWAKALNNGKEPRKKIIELYGPDNQRLESIEVSTNGDVNKRPIMRRVRHTK